MTWWHPLLEKLIEEARTLYGAMLSDVRFADARRLLREFDRDANTWVERRDAASATGVAEKLNELAAADALLSRMAADQKLVYEPRLKNTKKTIDFLVNGPRGIRCNGRRRRETSFEPRPFLLTPP